jgi:hypothetical protein
MIEAEAQFHSSKQLAITRLARLYLAVVEDSDLVREFCRHAETRKALLQDYRKQRRYLSRGMTRALRWWEPSEVTWQ